ncbi:endonuclease NucS domain-containing protein [Fervidobacterium thailandense]|uniref:Endonuclease NucS C-terminal domain-containing protein n=1 Tax=Fervidobacterium thailandense TaxID=1008305 RepID=A0A1E3G5J3_9BACT|nr:endonuclease NucS domain-containing protein [Fervidobacterium thailandense]ODN30928.1 hypothetical protein A4H02_03470 [Fervidobacterium thailandense]
MGYFLLAVSSKENLEICLQYNMAGFPGSQSGFWTFLEIEEGDYVSFLYGARIYNLYRVVKKKAFKNLSDPWKPIRFKSGKVYTFPYRLLLVPVRTFNESIVRPEFLYVAEDLLLRGGYRKTHFQAYQITLHFVSTLGQEIRSMNVSYYSAPEELEYVPKISLGNTKPRDGTVAFNELILQVLVKRKLGDVLGEIFDRLGIDGSGEEWEILSEKATEQGFVDLLIKPKYPLESARQIIVEVKKGKARKDSVEQVLDYIDKSANSVAGILIASDFDEKIVKLAKEKDGKILLLKYSLSTCGDGICTFEEMANKFNLEPVK